MKLENIRLCEAAYAAEAIRQSVLSKHRLRSLSATATAKLCILSSRRPWASQNGRGGLGRERPQAPEATFSVLCSRQEAINYRRVREKVSEYLKG